MQYQNSGLYEKPNSSKEKLDQDYPDWTDPNQPQNKNESRENINTKNT